MTKTLIVHHHLGLGDHICLNGIVWYLANNGNYKKVYLYCKQKNHDNIKQLYENTIVELVPVPDGMNELFFVDNDVSTKKNANANIDFVRIGFCYISSDIPCDVQFYKIAGVPYSERFEGFRLQRNFSEEQRLYEKLNPTGEDYIFVHDDPLRGFNINLANDQNLKVIRNDPSENIFHYGLLIERAKQFHCIESCLRCFCEHLDTDGVELFYHNTVRPNPLSTRKTWTWV